MERVMRIRDFRDLEVWQKSMDLAVDVYTIARRFPREERFELTSQLRKAVVSVSSNIAEGSGRATTKDLLNFLSTARGSLRESESLLLLSQRLGYASERELKAAIQLVHRIGQMLTALRKNLRKKLKRKKPASR
jgi:four helix bundle protein